MSARDARFGVERVVVDAVELEVLGKGGGETLEGGEALSDENVELGGVHTGRAVFQLGEALFEVDELGLDKIDRAILRALCAPC